MSIGPSKMLVLGFPSSKFLQISSKMTWCLPNGQVAASLWSLFCQRFAARRCRSLGHLQIFRWGGGTWSTQHGVRSCWGQGVIAVVFFSVRFVLTTEVLAKETGVYFHHGLNDGLCSYDCMWHVMTLGLRVLLMSHRATVKIMTNFAGRGWEKWFLTWTCTKPSPKNRQELFFWSHRQRSCRNKLFLDASGDFMQI